MSEEARGGRWRRAWRRGAVDRNRAVQVLRRADRMTFPGPREPESVLTRRLVEGWCAASIDAGWASPGRWWTPNVDLIADAILDDDDHVGLCAQLARQRADEGVTLAETIDDLGALFVAARLGSPPYATVRAVSLAWAAAAAQRITDAGCVDSRTGLGTVTHLESRLAELYSEGAKHGYSPAETHALVVVECRVIAESGDPWADTLRMSEIATCLRAVFDAGQVMGLAGPGRAVVVTPRAVDLPRHVEALHRMLAQWRPSATAATAPVIWVETLPAARAQAERLLGTLAI